MINLIKDRLPLILSFLILIFIGVLLIISMFRIKSNNKFIKLILCCLGLLTFGLGLYGMLFVLFFGFNS